MNYYPMLNGRQVRNDGCGRLAEDNRARSFWQSRMTTTDNGPAEPPELTDIRALAAALAREVVS